MAKHIQLPAPFEAIQLSYYEAICLRYLVNGQSCRDIAASLQLTEQTVHYHLTNVKAKFSYSRECSYEQWLQQLKEAE